DGSGQHDCRAQVGSGNRLCPYDWLRLARPHRFDQRGAPGWRRRSAPALRFRGTARRHSLGSKSVLTTIADIVAASRRLHGLVLRTPLRRSDWLSTLTGADVFLKLEVVQPTSSYKIRGALNAALKLQESAIENVRLVTASAGNHGRALAVAAESLNLPLTVFIPGDAPRSKVDAIRALGAELRFCPNYDEAERQAKRFAAESGGVYISPYSHPDVIAGAGTVMLEVLDD